jgi:ech hydrogenase subunit C
MAYLKRSPWIIHYDGTSCNGCDIEVLASLAPKYDIERLGVINTGNPKHADIFLITGSMNDQNREVVQNIYEQMPDPKVVIAIGICATSGGIFNECYNVIGGVNKVLPVDIYVPGCAARPESIIDGVVKALKILEEKKHKLIEMKLGQEAFIIEPATIEDAAEILALQKLAYQSEAELYNDFAFPPLMQTLPELKEDFKNITFFKAVINGVIIGSVRGCMKGDTCYIYRRIVHPMYQNLGIGKKLMNDIEFHFGFTSRFEVFTGHKSKRNINFYERLGYKQFKCEKVNDKRHRVYLEKIVDRIRE